MPCSADRFCRFRHERDNLVLLSDKRKVYQSRVRVFIGQIQNERRFVARKKHPYKPTYDCFHRRKHVKRRYRTRQIRRFLLRNNETQSQRILRTNRFATEIKLYIGL